MQDDMLFCSKCGNRLDPIGSNDRGSAKLGQLQAYDLAMNPRETTWQLVHELDGEESAEIFLSHANLCQEVTELLNNILSDGGSSKAIKEEATLHVLKMSRKMLSNAAKMLGDTDPLTELKMNFVSAMAAGENLSFDQMGPIVVSSDAIFTSLVGANAIHVGQIAESLDADIVRESDDCRSAAVEAATQYIRMWNALLDRYAAYPTAGYEGKGACAPTPDLTAQMWDCYCKLTEPLSLSDIEIIDESVWMDCLDVVKNWADFNDQISDDFANAMRRSIKERASSKEERSNAAYWAAHPEKAEQKQLLDERKAALSSELDELLEKLSLAEAEKSIITVKIDKLKAAIRDNESNLTVCNIPFVYRNDRKRWKAEIEEWTDEIRKLEPIAESHNIPIADARALVEAKEEEIAAVKLEIANLMCD